jgi:hypothetical protein
MPKGIHKKNNKALYEEIERQKKNKRNEYPEYIAEPERAVCRTCKRAESLARPGLDYYLNCRPLENFKGEIVKEGRGERKGWQTCGDHEPFEADMSPVPSQQWLPPTQIAESEVERGLI